MVSTSEQNHARCARRLPERCCLYRLPCVPCDVRLLMHDGGTQWMVLSATINNPEVASCLGGTHGGLLRLAVAKHSVIVDSDVVVGRRSRHRADVLGRRPQGPDCRRCHQRAAPCPLARVLAASSARRSRPSKLFQPYLMDMCILLVQRAGFTTRLKP